MSILGKTHRMFAIILIGCGIYSLTITYKSYPGIDFYKYWGVSKAKESSGAVLSSPYVNVEQYGRFLDSYSNKSDDPRLQVLRRKPVSLDPNVTPLLYVLFGLFPQDYSLSFLIFLLVRLILLLAIFYFLPPIRGVSLLTLVIGILLLFYHEPLASDSRVGNVNIFQLFSVSLIAYCIKCYIGKNPDEENTFTVTCILCALILLAMLKPNISLVILALATSLATMSGPKIIAKATLVAGLFGVLLIIIPCLYFNSWNIWIDWLHYISAISTEHRYPLWSGNLSTPIVVSTVFKISTHTVTMAMMAMFLVTTALMVVITGPINKRILKIFSDPYLGSSLAISCTFALSPLSWFHYYCMIIFPALWMITMQPGINSLRVMGGLSLLFSSGILSTLKGMELYSIYFVTVSWVPLWVGVLIVVAGMNNEDKIAITFLDSSNAK